MKKNSIHTEDPLEKAKRGLLVFDSAARNVIMARQVGFMPAAFMAACIHDGATAMHNHFFRPVSRLFMCRKKEEEMASTFRIAVLHRNAQELSHPAYTYG